MYSSKWIAHSVRFLCQLWMFAQLHYSKSHPQTAHQTHSFAHIICVIDVVHVANISSPPQIITITREYHKQRCARANMAIINWVLDRDFDMSRPWIFQQCRGATRRGFLDHGDVYVWCVLFMDYAICHHIHKHTYSAFAYLHCSPERRNMCAKTHKIAHARSQNN